MKGNRGRARMEEGLVCYRKIQRAERVKTEEKGGGGWGTQNPEKAASLASRTDMGQGGL